VKLRMGSRGSQLALWQANHVAALLREQGHDIAIEIIKTTGDRAQDVVFAEVGAKGMFIKEIEEALGEKRIDLAVHSLKDLPTELAEGFALAATPARVDARDALVSVKFANLAALPKGARVGTSSERRMAQLHALRPDIEIVEFRGNVDTRLRKLGDGQADAILLAAAGLERLGKTDWLRERFEPAEFCPAAGQGALAIETRIDDAATIDAVAFLDHEDTRFAVTAERAALAALGGGCQVPIGVHCRLKFTQHHRPQDEIFAVVASPQTGEVVRVHWHKPRDHDDPVAFGRHAAKMLLHSGAGHLLVTDAGHAG
jgi:hydroxymethylbilane synthase